MPCTSDREKFAVQVFFKSISLFIFAHLQIDKYLKQDFSTCAQVILLLQKSVGVLLLPSMLVAWKNSMLLFSFLLFIWQLFQCIVISGTLNNSLNTGIVQSEKQSCVLEIKISQKIHWNKNLNFNSRKKSSYFLGLPDKLSFIFNPYPLSAVFLPAVFDRPVLVGWQRVLYTQVFGYGHTSKAVQLRKNYHLLLLPLLVDFNQCLVPNCGF